MKRVKTLLKIVGVILAIIALLAGAIIGMRAYNAKKYPIMATMRSMADRDQYQTSDHVVAITGEHLNGFHFIPQQRLHPGTVVVYGGSEGSPSYAQAQSIADQGYEVLGLYFWGQPNQMPTLANIPLEEFNEVVSWIETNIDQPRPITAIGASKGAEYTALLAAYGFGLDNLVNYTPGDHSYPGLDFSGQAELPSFTYQGAPVPFASLRRVDTGVALAVAWDFIIGRPPAFRTEYQQAAERADESSRIDLTSFGGQALFFGGDQDAMWPGDVAARNLAGQSPRFEAHVYPGAGHVFSDRMDQAPNGWQIMLGGTIEGCANAYRESNIVLFDHLATWHGGI